MAHFATTRRKFALLTDTSLVGQDSECLAPFCYSDYHIVVGVE